MSMWMNWYNANIMQMRPVTLAGRNMVAIRMCREISSVGTNTYTRALQMSISKLYDRNHQGADRSERGRPGFGTVPDGRAWAHTDEGARTDRAGTSISDSITCISSRNDASTSDPNTSLSDGIHWFAMDRYRSQLLRH